MKVKIHHKSKISSHLIKLKENKKDKDKVFSLLEAKANLKIKQKLKHFLPKKIYKIKIMPQ